MAEMTQILSNMGVPITSVQGRRGKNRDFYTELEIMIQDIEQLERIIKQFRKNAVCLAGIQGDDVTCAQFCSGSQRRRRNQTGKP